MGLTARRGRERFDVRGKILESARKLIVKEGYRGVSMRKIAALIEYSPTVIYSHFNDKQSLFDALVEEDYKTLGRRMYQHASVEDPLQRLRLIAGEVVNFAIENPNRYSIIATTQGISVAHPVISEVKDGSIRNDTAAFIFETVREAISRNLIRPELLDAELISQTFYAGIHGVITMYLDNKPEEWVNWRPMQQRVELMLDMMLHGMSNSDNNSLPVK